jgi:hypothetical protein
MRPILIDPFCGLGGSAMGWFRAGFRVIGCDAVPQPDYPFEFHQGDAIEFIHEYGPRAAAAAGSPPCQHASGPTKGTNAKRNAAQGIEHPALIEDTRAAFEALGIPFVIENVSGSAVRRDLTLCGLSFGLRVFRHRWFELGGWSMRQPEHPSHRGHRVSGWRHGVRYDGDMLAVYGNGGGKASTAQCREALGIDWSWDRAQLVEAIPPAYTEHIGHALMAHVLATGRAAA